MITLDLAFVVQIVNFLVLILILNFVLYRPLRGILAQRRLEIESARERTLSVDHTVQDRMAEYEARLRNARSEVGVKRAELLKDAQAEEAGLIEKARSEASASLSAMRDRIASESSDARLLLKQQVEALSGDICEKILGRSL